MLEIITLIQLIVLVRTLNVFTIGNDLIKKYRSKTLEKLKIYKTCNFHVNLDLQDL